MLFRNLLKTVWLGSTNNSSLQHLMERNLSAHQARRNFAGAYSLIDRSAGHRRLVLVVAGYKPFLWSATLMRIKRHVPLDSDVCVLLPGLSQPEIETTCAANGWSLLSTIDNKLALAQNLAIRVHPAAEWIHKLDEDVFIGAGYCEGLERGFAAAGDDAHPGVAAPLLNVNGYSYRPFLSLIGAAQEYRRQFGEFRMACVGVNASDDGEAALAIWRRSLPFDSLVRELAQRPLAYSFVPHQFSIGAILFRREFWKLLGGFKVGPAGKLGVEEEHLCTFCMSEGTPIVCVHNVFCGHFGFGCQTAFMKEKIPVLRALDPELGL